MRAMSMCLYVGTYGSERHALADAEAVDKLYRDGVIGPYDSAVVVRDENGWVDVYTTEKPSEHGEEIGVGAGLIAGGIATAVAMAFFPPIMLATAAVGVAAEVAGGALGGGLIGGIVGGLVGHLRKGLSRAELDEVGRLLSDGQTAVVVVGEAKGDPAVDNGALTTTLHAARSVVREISFDGVVFARDLDAAVHKVTAAD